MRRRFVTALAALLLVVCPALTTGCGASSNPASADAVAASSSVAAGQAPAVPGKWVSIEDCEAVQAIVAAVKADSRPGAWRLIAELGSGSQIQLAEDGTIAFLGGTREGTGTCSFDTAGG
jgi:N-acetylglucosamine kinase-like BadF-type ATPase